MEEKRKRRWEFHSPDVGPAVLTSLEPSTLLRRQSSWTRLPTQQRYIHNSGWYSGRFKRRERRKSPIFQIPHDMHMVQVEVTRGHIVLMFYFHLFSKIKMTKKMTDQDEFSTRWSTKAKSSSRQVKQKVGRHVQSVEDNGFPIRKVNIEVSYYVYTDILLELFVVDAWKADRCSNEGCRRKSWQFYARSDTVSLLGRVIVSE